MFIQKLKQAAVGVQVFCSHLGGKGAQQAPPTPIHLHSVSKVLGRNASTEPEKRFGHRSRPDRQAQTCGVEGGEMFP